MAEDFSNLISQAYGSIGVTSPDAPGQQYWQQQLSSGALAPEDFTRTFLTAASGVTDPAYAANVSKAQELLSSGIQSLAPTTQPVDYTKTVSQAYQDVLGRAGDVSGSQYWANQLASGAIKPQDLAYNLAQAAVPIATGLEDRLALQKYLGKDIWAPEEYLKGTSGMGFRDIVDFINANIEDPVKITQAAAQYGIDPAEILAAKQAVGGQDIPTLQAIEDYFAQGRAGFEPRFQEMLGSTLGSAKKQQELQALLQEKFKNPNILLSRIYDPTEYSGMSLEKIETELRNSPINKLQDALQLSKIAKTVLGYTDDEASNLTNKAYDGKLEKNSVEEQIYNTLLEKNNITGADYEKLMSYAAVNKPNAPVFQQDPSLLVTYTPLQKKEGVTGQYGYYNDAPILNANFLEDKFGDKNQIKLNLDKDSDFGWTTKSKYAGEVKRGPALFGIGFNNRNDIEKAVELEQGIKNGTVGMSEDGYVQYGPEGGKYISAPQSENIRGGYDPQSENTLQKLQDAATQVGLDPKKFKSVGDLYDALEAKTNNLVQITGRAFNWDPQVAAKSGINITDGSRGGTNHAAVLYRQIGDKLMAVSTPKSFAFDDPKTKSWFQQTFGGLASIPFVAEIAAFATGANPAVYAAMKGAQTAALGGDVEDVLKSAGIAYLAPKVAQWAGGPQGIASLLPEGTPDIIVKGASNAAANVAVNAGIAALTGKDIGDAVTNALATSVVQTGAGQLPFIETVPKEYQAIVTRAIADIALGSDIQKALQKAIMTYGMKTGKETLKAA